MKFELENIITTTASLFLDHQLIPFRRRFTVISDKHLKIIVCVGTEIISTKKTSENVVQPRIEPGSLGYRSDCLTTRPLNQPLQKAIHSNF